VLVRVSADRDGSGVTWNPEASRRVGEHWTLDVEARAFTQISSRDPWNGCRDDDYLQIALERRFRGLYLQGTHDTSEGSK
jgi:hypothetical protein